MATMALEMKIQILEMKIPTLTPGRPTTIQKVRRKKNWTACSVHCVAHHAMTLPPWRSTWRSIARFRWSENIISLSYTVSLYLYRSLWLIAGCVSCPCDYSQSNQRHTLDVTTVAKASAALWSWAFTVEKSIPRWGIICSREIHLNLTTGICGHWMPWRFSGWGCQSTATPPAAFHAWFGRKKVPMPKVCLMTKWLNITAKLP